MDCTFLTQIPSYAGLRLGQEYRCLTRNVCLTSKLMNLEELLSTPAFILTLYQTETQERVIPPAPSGPFCPSEKARHTDPKGKQDTKKKKKTPACSSLSSCSMKKGFESWDFKNCFLFPALFSFVFYIFRIHSGSISLLFFFNQKVILKNNGILMYAIDMDNQGFKKHIRVSRHRR